MPKLEVVQSSIVKEENKEEVLKEPVLAVTPPPILNTQSDSTVTDPISMQSPITQEQSTSQ